MLVDSNTDRLAYVSHGLTGYLVRSRIIERLCAGSDPGAIDDVIAFAGDGDGDGDGSVLRRLANGDLAADDPAGNVYALEVLCDYFGMALANDELAPIGGPEALEEFSDALTGVGFDGHVSPRELMDFRPPVPVPSPDDFPFVHTVAHADAYPVAVAYEAVVPALDGTDWGPAADQLAQWLFATHRSGKDLVIFYY